MILRRLDSEASYEYTILITIEVERADHGGLECIPKKLKNVAPGCKEAAFYQFREE
jgi:hypothetical protein